METISLQTLSHHETEQVSGGLLFIASVIGGTIGAIIYAEKMGGYEGVNSAFANAMLGLSRYYRHAPGQNVFAL